VSISLIVLTSFLHYYESSPFVFRSRTARCDCTDCPCFTYRTFLFSSHLRSGPLFCTVTTDDSCA
ncbi:hypothetical protein BGW80DRAFT_1351156, partial [Lactifluus volemus]